MKYIIVDWYGTEYGEIYDTEAEAEQGATFLNMEFDDEKYSVREV